MLIFKDIVIWKSWKYLRKMGYINWQDEKKQKHMGWNIQCFWNTEDANIRSKSKRVFVPGDGVKSYAMFFTLKDAVEFVEMKRIKNLAEQTARDFQAKLDNENPMPTV